MRGWDVSVYLIISNTALRPSPTTLGRAALALSVSEASLSVSEPSCQAAAAATYDRYMIYERPLFRFIHGIEITVCD